MISTKLFPILQKFVPTDRIDTVLRAFKQDPIFWKTITDPKTLERIDQDWPGKDVEFTPASLALFDLDPALLQNHGLENPPSVELLENAMLAFENYLHQREAVDNLKDAALLSLALYKKFEQGQDWPRLLREIANQQNLESGEEWTKMWGCPFEILNGVSDDQSDFLQSQLRIRQPEFGLDMLNHLICSLPADLDERTALYKNAVSIASLTQQVEAVKELRFSGEESLAKNVARELLERHVLTDLEVKSAREIWKESEKALEIANNYRLLAALAQLAGEYNTAEKLLKVAINNYSAELTGALLQKSALSVQTGKSAKSILEQIPQTNLEDVSVQNEIVKSVGKETGLSKDLSNPLSELFHAEEILNAGNDALAKQIAEDATNSEQSAESNLADLVSSERALNWDPNRLVKQLMELGLWQQARNLVDLLLKKAPGDMGLIANSIKIAEEMNDSANLISSLEDSLVLGYDNIQLHKKLANAYLRQEEWQNAYESFASLLEKEDTSDTTDFTGLAQAALKIGKIEEAIENAQKTLQLSPENGTALSVLGYAYHKQGDAEKAIEFLNKSISLTPDSVEPWLLVAELHKEKGEIDQSIEVLKTANSTFPGDQKITRQLARELLNQGQAASALAILREAQNKGNPDLETAVLTIQAEKSLNLPEVAELIEQIYRIYPNSPEAIYEYANYQLNNGQKETAKTLLKSISECEDAPSEWKLAYVDSIIGEDYRNLHQYQIPEGAAAAQAKKILSETLMDEPENVYAKVLAAELAIKEGQAEKAFSFLSQLLKENSTENSSFFDRIKAGFAWAATLLKKFDLALSAIQSIVEAHPQWTAARENLAEIDEATGEISAAVDQASQVIESASNVAESAEWFVNFMSNLGKEDEAEKTLETLVKTHKNKLPLYEKIAELKFKRDAVEEVKEISEKVKHNLPKSKEDNEIVKAAQLFKKIGDQNAVIDALKMRTSNSMVPAAEAFSDLAGYLRSLGQNDQTLIALDDAEKRMGKQRWINILKAETLHALGESQQAFNILNVLPEENGTQPDPKDLNFIPVDWQDLFGADPQIQSLEQDLAFESGNYAAVFEPEGNNSGTPRNPSIRIEADHALGTGVEIIKWLETNAEDEAACANSVLAAQVSELLMDGGRIQTAGEILMKALDLHPEDGLLKLQAARQSALSSDWQTAEDLYNQEISDFSTQMKITGAKSVCTVRNIVKISEALSHWNDASIWSKKLLKAQPENQAAKITRLQFLVKALEYKEETKDLRIVEHSLSSKAIADSRDELTAMIANLENEENSEIVHWTTRGKVILEPNQGNIRKLALITPDAEDIAAMMIALNRSDQYSTAVQLAKKHDNEPLVLFVQAKCQQERDPQAALNTLEKLARTKAVIPASYALAGKINQDQKVYYSAINNYEEGLSYWPNEYGWHELAADNWSSVGDLQNCAAHLEKAVELDPEKTEYHLKLGKVYLQNNDNEKAIEQLKIVCKNEVNQYEAWENLAEAYYKEGQADLALESAEKAAEVNAFSVKPHLLSAKINLDKGDAGKALDQVKQALVHEEKNAEGQLILGKAWLAKGDKLQALQALEKVPQIRDVTVQQLIEHASLVKEINGAANARGMLESLAENYPDNLDVLNMLAESQLANGEVSAAEKTAQQSIRLQEEQPKMQRFLGNLEFQCGALDQAVHHFSQAIAQNPEEIETYLELSKVYEQQRDHTSAWNTLNTALTLDPKNLKAILAAANLMKNSKDYTKAEELLRRAVEIAPNDLNVRRQLGAVIALNLVESSQEASSHI